jgi:hypothetical protein
MSNTGYAESSQVAMYTAYQNRVSAARENYNLVIQNYNNAMTEARLQNNSALAQIALDAQAKQLELTLLMVQNRNTLLQQKVNQKLAIDSEHYNRYMSVLDKIYKDEALAEEKRQAELDRQFKEAQAALDRQHDFALLDAKTQDEKELADYNYQIAKKKLADELANEKALLKYKYDLEKQNSSGSSYNSKAITKNSGKIGSTTGGKKATTKSDTPSGNSSTKKTPVNLKSVLDLGAPYNANHVASLVSSGKVSMTEKNGEIVFKKNILPANPFGAGSALNLDAPWKKGK